MINFDTADSFFSYRIPLRLTPMKCRTFTFDLASISKQLVDPCVEVAKPGIYGAKSENPANMMNMRQHPGVTCLDL